MICFVSKFYKFDCVRIQSMQLKSILLLFFSLACLPLWAQLSQGGQPMPIQQLKVARASSFVSLTVPAEEIQLVKNLQKEQPQLKAFRFAYSIPVDFSTENSGTWIESGDWKIWQLKLESPGALSLNVIFSRYYVPEGARLFLFSEDGSDLIGAFTAQNNKSDGVLATMPVAGDRLILQYEEPLDAEFSGELVLESVNHDFVGLKAYNGDRRPLGESGSCNVNVNCDYLQKYREAANGVCRILIRGTELCTGTLLNDVPADSTPYLLTASHCIENATDASSSVFLFNYESPYCKSIDGEVLNSLSGSSLRASSSELDFSLVELSVAPPKSYQPYYLGWDHSSSAPDSTVSIHHPLGDIKKVAIDRNSPSAASYSEDYVSGSFWQISNWEEGTTEAGSSGAALIDPDMRVRGSLVGGEATCSNPVNDYFAQFRFAWNHFSESDKQLKTWLDPNNSGTTAISGLNPYADEQQCTVLTNMKDADSHFDGLIDVTNESSGYYSGTNAYGFTEFAEAFQFETSCNVQGLTLGIANKSISSSIAVLTVSVYEGGDIPGTLLYSQDFELTNQEAGVMNYLAFDQQVSTDGNFYLAWSIEDLGANDVFAVFLADRTDDTSNSFFIRDGGDWYSYSEKSNTTNGSAAVMEALVCFYDESVEYNPFEDENVDVVAYPNPFVYGQELTIRFEDDVQPSKPEIFDLLGNRYAVSSTLTGLDRMAFDFNGFRPGIYFVRLTSQISGKNYTQKVLYLGGE
ncbi:putative secreted protein (Por secretion system target) [Mangrovibacterium diazotrophicum]|uniref:Putative secreted protein (Por secretion system target) n=2 Tax=Mangrovibacterium diazotrophicum TaxID=1261403 RepID=A0A419VYS7_9BACT|nr:putative secreted protein (Por secretion system target) [Mangrovibacterium diazotrophicum]